MPSGHIIQLRRKLVVAFVGKHFAFQNREDFHCFAARPCCRVLICQQK